MTYTRRPRVKVTAPPDDTWDKVSMTGGTPMYYNRAGQPCSLREWTTLFEDHKRRFLGRDFVLGAWVATIYDGVHLDIFSPGPPTMFETTVTYKNSPLGRVVAQAAFDAAQRSGYYAYTVTDTAVHGEVIREFDPSVERIIMVPSYEGGAALGGTP